MLCPALISTRGHPRRPDVRTISRDAILCTIAQVFGGCVGAVIANIMFERPVSFSYHSIIGCIGCRSDRPSACFFPSMARALDRPRRPHDRVWISGAYWFTSSTNFANPAITTARTLWFLAGIKPSSAPMFIVMQLIGATLAFALIRFLYPHTTEETVDA